MALLAGQWTNAIDQLRTEGSFVGITLFHNGVWASSYAELVVENDATHASVKPLEADLEAAYTRFQSAQNDLTAIQTAQNGLKDKIELAHNPAYAPVIKDLYNAQLEAIRVNSDLPTTYNALMAVIAAAPTAFQNRFANYVIVRTAIDLAATPHTTAQQRNICIMADTFVSLLVPLLVA